MIVVTIAAISALPLKPPILLRKILLPVIGVMLGAGFHPSLLDAPAAWIGPLLTLPAFIGLAFAAAFAIFRNIGKYDVVTAYFAAAPGGLNDMMIIGSEAGGNERQIALAHATRILIVVAMVSLFYGLVLNVTTTGSDRPYVTFADVPLRDLAILAACAVIGALGAPYLRVPAPQILGPMVLSGLVHITGVTDAPPPSLIVNAAQLVLGTVIGCRFLGVSIREMAKDLATSAIATIAMLAAALIASYAVAQVTALPMDQVFLSYSPGGLVEMSLLALALGADIAFVATLHILRIVLVIAAAPVVFRAFKRSAP